MIYYLIEVKENTYSYYGKEKFPKRSYGRYHGRILHINSTEDSSIPFIVEEIAYKSKKGAIQGAKKLQKEKPNAKITIQTVKIE